MRPFEEDEQAIWDSTFIGQVEQLHRQRRILGRVIAKSLGRVMRGGDRATRIFDMVPAPHTERLEMAVDIVETPSERAERLSQMLFNSIVEKGGSEELACEAADRLLVSLLMEGLNETRQMVAS